MEDLKVKIETRLRRGPWGTKATSENFATTKTSFLEKYDSVLIVQQCSNKININPHKQPDSN